MDIRVGDIRHPVKPGVCRIYVGRPKGFRTSGELEFGNPFEITKQRKIGEASAAFREHLKAELRKGNTDKLDQLTTLCEQAHERGETVELACWCHGSANCHAQVWKKAVIWWSGRRPASSHVCSSCEQPVRDADLVWVGGDRQLGEGAAMCAGCYSDWQKMRASECSECTDEWRCDDCAAAALLRHVRSMPPKPIDCVDCGETKLPEDGAMLNQEGWHCHTCQLVPA